MPSFFLFSKDQIIAFHYFYKLFLVKLTWKEKEIANGSHINHTFPSYIENVITWQM